MAIAATVAICKITKTAILQHQNLGSIWIWRANFNFNSYRTSLVLIKTSKNLLHHVNQLPSTWNSHTSILFHWSSALLLLYSPIHLSRLIKPQNCLLYRSDSFHDQALLCLYKMNHMTTKVEFLHPTQNHKIEVKM